MLGPETAHSPNAEDLSTAYWVLLALAALIALAVNGALVAMLVRYRARRGRQPARFRGRPRTQARIGALLGVIAVALLVFGIVYTDKAQKVEASGSNGLAGTDVLRIKAIGQQWIWRYEYPALESGGAPAAGGASATGSTGTLAQNFAEVFSYEELVVPVDTTVELDVDSTDVVHRWWVPSLGGKVDAVPGRINRTWFRADEEGTYEGQSAGYSGASYAVMRTTVKVVSAAEYQAWVTQQAADIKAAQTAVQQQIAAAATSGSPGSTSP